MKNKHYNALIIILIMVISVCYINCTKSEIGSYSNDINTTIYYLPESEYNLLLQSPSMEQLTGKSKYEFSFSYDTKTAIRDFEFNTNVIFESMDTRDRSDCLHLLYREIYGIPQAMSEMSRANKTIKLQAAFFTDGYPLALWAKENGDNILFLIKAVSFPETPIEETQYRFEKLTQGG